MMLNAQDNQLVSQTGPGTPMGKLMRRYWIPALLSWELPDSDCAPVRVKLLGEELIAFRDTEGEVGLVDNYCPHRRASLFFGRNEECGLRCVYHGWKFDVEGNCVDMPTELAADKLKPEVKLKAYPCQEHAGIVWAYLGP
ncbi:MAG: Rieske 2Fe-2S domain-containing protein, partial [Pseudomonadales bacterium]|nr:Rieske 2Fe-2S domain-containing protein [Pseudomonadales bacterium]